MLLVWLVAAVLLAAQCPPSRAGRVLLVSGQFGSHLQERHAVGDVLIRQGHQVYTIIQDSQPPAYIAQLEAKGYHVVIFHLPEGEEPFVGKTWNGVIRRIIFSDDSEAFVATGQTATRFEMRDCELMLQPDFIRHLRSLQLDIALAENFYLSQCNMLVPYVLGIPFLSYFSHHLLSTTGLPVLPSTVPMIMSGFTDNMSFMERLQNTGIFFNWLVTENYLGFHRDTRLDLLRKHAPGLSSWVELGKKSCIVFHFRDYTLDTIIPTLPQFINLPGITYRPPGELPDQYKAIINQSTHGIIVFSMGSSITEFPDRIFTKFMNVFREIPQHVIMRYKADVITSDVPHNVHLFHWLPQNDLLGHAETRVFITHGGNNGQYEAAYHNVPMLTVPVFAEQFHNAHRVEMRHSGLTLNFQTFTEGDLRRALDELVNNSVYSDNAERISAILKARPVLPAEEAAYWVNYTLHLGCDHLRWRAVDAPWYVVYMLDIALLGVVVLLAVCLVVFWVMRRLLCSVLEDRKSKYD